MQYSSIIQIINYTHITHFWILNNHINTLTSNEDYFIVLLKQCRNAYTNLLSVAPHCHKYLTVSRMTFSFSTIFNVSKLDFDDPEERVFVLDKCFAYVHEWSFYCRASAPLCSPMH